MDGLSFHCSAVAFIANIFLSSNYKNKLLEFVLLPRKFLALIFCTILVGSTVSYNFKMSLILKRET